jgi:serine/threonine protein phosphatase PrpC
MFQRAIEAWLSRPVPERATNQCFDLPAILATDIGLVRSENQDRVAAMRIASTGTEGRSHIALAVADGMGGMQNGAECATLAISSFFRTLAIYRHIEIKRRVSTAIRYSNEEVFKYSKGNGGSTLTAFVVDETMRPLLVHVGDSRVYAFGERNKIKRLTIDDSLAEAVGGYDRDLLQFIGMGPSMQPHIEPVSEKSKYLAITTDGVHFTESGTFEKILFNSPNIKSAAERLSAVARWSGGPDNASIATFDLHLVMNKTQSRDENGIQFWDPFGNMITIRPPVELMIAPDIEADVNENLQTPQPDRRRKSRGTSVRSRDNVLKRQRKPKKDKLLDDGEQLEIKIEQDPELGKEDA